MYERPKFIHRTDCVDRIEANRDVLVGVKVLLTARLADDRRNEAQGLQQALEAAAATATFLMAYHSGSPPCPWMTVRV